MKVKQVKGSECPHCGEFVPLPDKKAKQVLVPDPDKAEVVIRFQCGECEELYEDRDDALECCRE